LADGTVLISEDQYKNLFDDLMSALAGAGMIVDVTFVPEEGYEIKKIELSNAQYPCLQGWIV
jgi:hypothetical protein